VAKASGGRSVQGLHQGEEGSECPQDEKDGIGEEKQGIREE